MMTNVTKPRMITVPSFPSSTLDQMAADTTLPVVPKDRVYPVAVTVADYDTAGVPSAVRSLEGRDGSYRSLTD
jgi:hypothetical protein